MGYVKKLAANVISSKHIKLWEPVNLRSGRISVPSSHFVLRRLPVFSALNSGTIIVLFPLNRHTHMFVCICMCIHICVCISFNIHIYWHNSLSSCLSTAKPRFSLTRWSQCHYPQIDLMLEQLIFKASSWLLEFLPLASTKQRTDSWRLCRCKPDLVWAMTMYAGHRFPNPKDTCDSGPPNKQYP